VCFVDSFYRIASRGVKCGATGDRHKFDTDQISSTQIFPIQVHESKPTLLFKLPRNPVVVWTSTAAKQGDLRIYFRP
jgi:hypothetical protein